MLFNTILKAEDSAGAYSPTSDFWYAPIGMTSATGLNVNALSAMKVSALYACVIIISETMAALPRAIYQKINSDSRKKLDNFPLSIVLNVTANERQTAFEFWQMQVAFGCLYGNSYAKIIPGYLGSVTYLEPMRPDCVTVQIMTNGRKRYIYRDPFNNYAEEVLTQDEVLHIPGYSRDGVQGIAPILFANDAIGLSLATEMFGSKFFSNDATPSFVLEHPGKLKPEGADNIRKSWLQKFSGVSNAHGVAVLEEGMKANTIGGTNENNQFLETRKYQIAEIGRFFRIPQHMINELEKSSFSNIEQQSMEFVKYTLNPWCVRIEQRVNHQLIDLPEKYYMKHTLDALLRAETINRYTAYKMGIETGFLTRNEVRVKEDLNPLDGLDDPLTPLNMTTGQPQNAVDDAGKDNPPAGNTDTPPDAAAQDKILRQLAINGVYEPFINDIAERLANAEIQKMEKIVGMENLATFDARVEKDATNHFTYVFKTLVPFSVLTTKLGTDFDVYAFAESRKNAFVNHFAGNMAGANKYIMEAKAHLAENIRLTLTKGIDTPCQKDI